MTQKHVVFDTDPGIDDAMALLYLNACENIDLVGITTILGNADIEQCTRNALILRDMFDVDAPVYQGSARHINGSLPDDYPDFVHGTDGLGDVGLPPVRSQVEDEDAVTALINLSKEYSGELTLLAVGRLTNVALAIQQDEAFTGRLKEIIIMGGTHEHPGNVTPWAEANIIGDPEAAEMVFRSEAPLTMVGLDVTTQTRMSHEYLEPIANGLPFGQFILQINRTYADYHVRTENRHDFPVHDSSAIAFTARPELFGGVTGYLSCVLEGDQRGRTVFKEDGSGPHKVCMSVNSDAMLEDYARRVSSYY